MIKAKTLSQFSHRLRAMNALPWWIDVEPAVNDDDGWKFELVVTAEPII